jgi:hypothetical protein
MGSILSFFSEDASDGSAKWLAEAQEASDYNIRVRLARNRVSQAIRTGDFKAAMHGLESWPESVRLVLNLQDRSANALAT